MDIGDLTERQNEPSAANRASDVHELLIGIQNFKNRYAQYLEMCGGNKKLNKFEFSEIFCSSFYRLFRKIYFIHNVSYFNRSINTNRMSSVLIYFR